MSATQIANITPMPIDTVLAIAQMTNSVLAFGGVDAAREALIERGYSFRAANRVIEMAPVIASFFAP